MDNSHHKHRGSVLLVAVIFGALIAIGIGTYLTLAQTSFAMAQRSFLQASALSLAELGLEEAMSCYNSVDELGSDAAWSAWDPVSGSTIARQKTFTTYQLADGTFSQFKPDAGSTAVVKVWVENNNPGEFVFPHIVAKAIVTPVSGPGYVRMVEMIIRRRGVFAVGIVAKGQVTLSPNAMSDSWISDPDGNPTTPAVAYSATTRRANTFVGTYSAQEYALNVDSADIYGRAGSGGGAVLKNSGARLSGNWGNNEWDGSRFSTNFIGDPALPLAPTPSVINSISTVINSSVAFPRTGDAINPNDGKYYYSLTGGQIALAGSDSVTIAAGQSVVFLATSHSGLTAVQTTGNGAIQVDMGGRLEIHTNGNIKFGGNGLMNLNTSPATALIYGTNTVNEGQSITLSGNGANVVAIYAPNAVLTVSGSGDFYGSVIASSINANGGGSFHYDESMGKFFYSTPTGNPWGIKQWIELTTPEQRQAYSGNFNF